MLVTRVESFHFVFKEWSGRKETTTSKSRGTENPTKTGLSMLLLSNSSRKRKRKPPQDETEETKESEPQSACQILFFYLYRKSERN